MSIVKSIIIGITTPKYYYCNVLMLPIEEEKEIEEKKKERKNVSLFRFLTILCKTIILFSIKGVAYHSHTVPNNTQPYPTYPPLNYAQP